MCTETINRVAKNTGVIILGEVIGRLINLVTIIFLARYLGARNFGVYSFVFAYLGFFGIIMNLGIGSILVREISRDKSKADRLIGNAVVMRIILSLFALALACLIISFLHYPFNTKLLVYAASLSFLFSFGGVYGLMFRVNPKMEYPTFVDVLSDLLKFPLFLYVIFTDIVSLG